MAKNLFEQFLSFAASKLAGPISHENIYRDEAQSGLTGVAKYLARQDAAAKAEEAATLPAGTSSVEKYLARKAALEAAQQAQTPAESEPAPEQPLTGVAKYLAGQGKAQKPAVKAEAPAPAAPSTRVAKYLAGQIEPAKAPAPAPAPAAPAPTTGVGKYLAGSYTSEVSKGASSAPKKAEKAAAPAKAKAAAAKTPEPAPIQAAQAAEPPKASGMIHFDDGKQCQASTSRGSQCKNTNNLGHIQRTINKQKYQFNVCKQHHNESFKPFAPLLEA